MYIKTLIAHEKQEITEMIDDSKFDEFSQQKESMDLGLNQYQELFEMAPVGYFILDRFGVIKNVNISGCQIMGLPKKKLIGEFFYTYILSKQCKNRFLKYIKEVFETGTKQQIECKLKNDTANEFYGLVQTAVLKDEFNNFKNFILTLDNIDKQKQQEKILERALNKEKKLNDMKSQFIAIASHEFRTPLATILTSSELIEKYNKPEDETKKETHFRKIFGAVHRIKEILADFLSENEIENGKINNLPTKLNVKSFMESLIKENIYNSAIHNISYRHIGLDSEVSLDKKILKTSLINLLINAYKYSPKGGLIEVKSHQYENYITFSVKDYGIGIPKNDQDMVFEPFFRAKNVEHIQGTGLGLNITKRLIQIMGGTIVFKTQENKGTVFTIKIPIF